MHSSELAPSIRVLAANKVEAKIGYDILLDAVRQIAATSNGTISQDVPDQGFIEARFKHFMSLAGLRVNWQFRQLDSGEITVEATGRFPDALDTFGSAAKKGQEQIETLIAFLQEHHGATIQMAAATPSGPPRAGAPPSAQHAPAYAAARGPSHSGMASWALVCGLFGVATFGPIPGLLGIVLGAVARSKMFKAQNFDGRGMATAGLVLGIISTVFGGILAWILILSSG